MGFEKFNHNLEPSSEDEPDEGKDSEPKKKKRSSASGKKSDSTAPSESTKAERPKTEPEDLLRSLLGKESKESEPESAAGESSTEGEATAEAPEAVNGEKLPLEELTPEETALAAAEYIAERERQISSEEPDPADAGEDSAANRADRLFLQLVGQRLTSESAAVPLSETIDLAYQEAERRVTETGAEAGEQEIWSREKRESVDKARDNADPEEPAVQVHSRPGRAPAEKTAGAQNSRRAQEAFVAGGLIGYLVGRRRGRIKTEKRLGTVQRRLEDETSRIRQQIISKEAEIRKLATEVQSAGALVRPLEVATLPAPPTPEQASFKSKPLAERAPETRRSRTITPDKIGRVIVKSQLPERSAATRPKAARAKLLNRSEALSLSEEVVIEGVTLRQIYETKLISERGLRRVLHEHLGGGEVKRVLRQELIKKEMSYERDPLLRDKPVALTAAGGDANAAAGVNPAVKASSKPATRQTGTASGNNKVLRAKAKKSPRPAPPPELLAVMAAIVLLLIIALIVTAVRYG